MYTVTKTGYDVGEPVAIEATADVRFIPDVGTFPLEMELLRPDVAGPMLSWTLAVTLMVEEVEP